MGTYLDRILAGHRAAAADLRPLEALLDEARQCEPARPFEAALAFTGERQLAVIAEVKRRSPSRGDLAVDLDAAEVALAYDRGGATCLSVLTDTDWFGGSVADLQAARAAVDLPVLRKDFTVAALDDAELADLHGLGRELGLDVLVEVHDEAELERALTVGSTMIGVNQRDLVTFAVDTERAVRVARLMPEGIVRVAESGITGTADAVVLAAAGFHAVLVGESVVTSGDRAGSVTRLRVRRR